MADPVKGGGTSVPILFITNNSKSPGVTTCWKRSIPSDPSIALLLSCKLGSIPPSAAKADVIILVMIPNCLTLAGGVIHT